MPASWRRRTLLLASRPRARCWSMFPGWSPPTTPDTRPRAGGAARRVRHLGAPRLVVRALASTRRTSWRSRRRSAQYRQAQRIDGPLFLGMDTHALSEPAFASALEVLAANGVEVMIDADDGYTPTPVDLARHPRPTTAAARSGSPTASSSRRRTTRPRTAASSTTRPTAARPTPTSPAGSSRRANALLGGGNSRRAAHAVRQRAAPRPTTHRHDYITPYVDDLAQRDRHGRHPRRAAAHRRRSARRRRRRTTGTRSPSATASTSTVVNDAVDPTFRFMTRRLGRQDPHGLLVAVRDGAA